MLNINQKGLAHLLLILIAALGIIAFILISSSADFKNKLFSTIFPNKPKSHAEEFSVPPTRFASNEILIKVKNDVKDKVKENKDDTGIASLNEKLKDAKAVKFEKVIKPTKNSHPDDPILQWYKLTLPGNKEIVERDKAEQNPQAKELDRVLGNLKKDPNIETVELNFVIHSDQSTPTIPNDPYFTSLWGLNNTGQSGGTADADIDAPEAWNTAHDSDVVVGVIDSGIDYNHEDLRDNLWTNQGERGWDSSLYKDKGWNGVDDDNNGYIDDYHGWNWVNNTNDPMDDYGHGTLVAGIIAATGNNGTGVAGVNWRGKVVALKFIDSSNNGFSESAAIAVNYASMMGIKITNNSWGGLSFSQILYDAISSANTNGNLFIASAGNNYGNNNDTSPHYPSSYDLPNIIAVAGTDNYDGLAYWSNYGPTSVDLGAPGSSIWSTAMKGYCTLCNYNSGYNSRSGTSYAAPYVAGAASLLWSYNRSLAASQIKSKLLYSGNSLASLNGKVLSGRRLNLNNTIDIEDTIPPSAVSNLSTVSTSFSSVVLQWSATGDDGTTGTASTYDLRYSTSPIDDTNFTQVTQMTGPNPTVAGTSQSFTVSGLNSSTQYYFALKVIDNLGNVSPISNIVTARTADATSFLNDNFENGIGNWVVTGSTGVSGDTTGLWHISQKRSVSPSHAWYYGQETTSNYDTGYRNWGILTSPIIDLINATDAALQFSYFIDTESGSSIDKAEVKISADNGSTWTRVWYKTASSNGWSVRTINLSSYLGKQIKIQFSFDNVYWGYDFYEGWYVDDVSVVGVSPPTQSYSLNAGWNLFGVPLTTSPVLTANSILSKTGSNCSEVDRWDVATQTWQSSLNNDFPIEAGKGYAIKCSPNGSFTITGTPVNNLPTLATGWNLVSLPYDSNYANVSEFYNAFDATIKSNIREIDRYINGGWDGYITSINLKNFTVSKDQGYFVKYQSPGTTVSALSLPPEPTPAPTIPPNATKVGSDGTWCLLSDTSSSYFTKGTCQDKTGVYTDYCDQSTVKNYYCGGSWNGSAWSNVACEAGGYVCSSNGGSCSDGACVLPGYIQGRVCSSKACDFTHGSGIAGAQIVINGVPYTASSTGVYGVSPLIPLALNTYSVIYKAAKYNDSAPQEVKITSPDTKTQLFITLTK